MSPLALSLRFLQTQSDEHLAALARAGHERAFEALVRRYRRELLAYCRRVGSTSTHPEDTLQQALLQAWSAIRTGVEVRDPRAWLYRIVHNVAISNQRRPIIIPVQMQETAGANGADLEAERRMAARDALAGLAALPDLQREVMVGTAVDGMSHEELASALGLSSGAVRGLIYRARATLRAAAAAITPGPLISWALRTGSGPGSGFYDALAGSGTAGLGGLLVKGGAIAVTAGAIATATGISSSHKPVHHRATNAAAVAQRRAVHRPAVTPVASRTLLVAEPTRAHAAPVRGPARHDAAPHSSASGGSDGSFTSRTSGRGPADRGSGERHHGGDAHGGAGLDRGGSTSSGGDGSPSAGGGTRSGSGSTDGGGGGGTADGSQSGGGATLSSGESGSDHGGELSRTAGASGGSDRGGGLSGDGSTAPSVSSDDGGSGSDGGGVTATTTAAATTTTTMSGSDGPSGSGSTATVGPST